MSSTVIKCKQRHHLILSNHGQSITLFSLIHWKYLPAVLFKRPFSYVVSSCGIVYCLKQTNLKRVEKLLKLTLKVK